MRILLINLDRSPERLKRMDEVLTGSGLTFERVPAVDGKLLSEAEKTRWLGGDGSFYPLGPGEIGCFLSHRACWEIAAAGPDSHAVVLEDDVHIGSDAQAIIGDAGWIPADADIVKLETTFRRTHVEKSAAAQVVGRQVSRLRGEHTGTAGYIVSRKGAEKLLIRSATFSDPLDQFMFNPRLSMFSALVTYQLVPALCVQDENFHRGGSDAALRSTLHGERRLNRRTGMARLKREIERPLQQIGGILRGLMGNLFTNRKWGSIPFN